MNSSLRPSSFPPNCLPTKGHPAPAIVNDSIYIAHKRLALAQSDERPMPVLQQSVESEATSQPPLADGDDRGNSFRVDSMPAFMPTIRILDALTPTRRPGVFAHLERQAKQWKVQLEPSLPLMNKVTQVKNALVAANFLVANGDGAYHPAPKLFYNHSPEHSRLFDRGHSRFDLGDQLPWLPQSTRRALCAMLIHRDHAQIAGAEAFLNDIDTCLTRVLADGESAHIVSRVDCSLDFAPLTRLRSYYMHDVLFDEKQVVESGGGGSFFVGMTTSGHHVAIKRIEREGELEVMAHRSMQLGGYYVAGRESHRASKPAWWLAMPLYAGTLKTFGARFINVPWDDQRSPRVLIGARYVMAEVMRNLAFLHRKVGAVHQDIKHGNLFVDVTNKRIRLGDFGLAVRADAQGMAQARGFTGGYASPEQLLGGLLTPSSDVFSLSVVLIEAIIAHHKLLRESIQKRRTRPMAETFFVQDALATSYDSPYQMSYTVWQALSRLTFDVSTSTMLAEPSLSSFDPELVKIHARHFRYIDRAMKQFDPGLWTVLQRGLSESAEARPTAQEMLNWAKASLPQVDRAMMQDVWGTLPLYESKITQSLRQLRRQMPKTPYERDEG